MIMSVEPGRNWKKPTYDNQQKTPWNLSTTKGIMQTYSKKVVLASKQQLKFALFFAS